MKHNYKRITALAGMTALLVSMPVSVYAGQIRNTYTANLSNVLGSGKQRFHQIIQSFILCMKELFRPNGTTAIWEVIL